MELRSNRWSAAIAATAAGMVLAVPASAQVAASGQPAPTAKPKDPNRIICEKVEETGSRVSTKRVCMTAEQWEQRRRSDREYVEDSQQRSLEPNSG